MKKLLIVLGLALLGVCGFAQGDKLRPQFAYYGFEITEWMPPTNYINISQRYRWIAGMFDSTLHAPIGATASLRTGGAGAGGALFVDSLGADSGLYVYYNGTWHAQTSGSSGNFIQNQYASKQTANSWYDSTKLRKIRLAYDDSTFNPAFQYGPAAPATFYDGKLISALDRDSANAANDEWPYSINTAYSFGRVTNVTSAHQTYYRGNGVFHQWYRTNTTGGNVYSVGGDLGYALKGITTYQNMTGTSGRIPFQGGTVYFDAVPAVIGSINTLTQYGSGSTHFMLNGHYSAITGYHNLQSGDTIEYWKGFLAGGYSVGAHLQVATNFSSPISPTAAQVGTAWGFYSDDPLQKSYNKFGGRVGIGQFEFGTEKTPTFKASGALQINSHSRGFIPSRMTAAERLAITADTSLFIFDTDSLRYMGYTGGAWKGIAWTGEASGGSGSGTVNSGLLGKPAYYVTNPSGTVVDDYEPISLLTSGNLWKITSQNATDIPVTITGHASQSGNLFVIEASDGTDNLVYTSAKALTLNNIASNTEGLIINSNGSMQYSVQNNGGTQWLIYSDADATSGQHYYTATTAPIVYSINATEAGRWNATGYLQLSRAATTWVGGTISTQYTPVGNVGSGEDNLMTYSLPAGMLGKDGDILEIEMGFTTAANANSKTIKFHFGAYNETIPAFTASGTHVVIKVVIMRTGAATQTLTFMHVNDNGTTTTVGSATHAPTETLSGAITIKATGEATSNDDIVQRLLSIKYFPGS